MAPNTGTHDISSLLAANIQSVAAFGEDRISEILSADLAAHNAITTEMINEMATPSTDRQRVYGTSADGEMVEVDEYGAAPTQKAKTGFTVGFPLRLFQFNLGWTRKWMQNHTPADMAIATQGAERAHQRAIAREIKRAIFGSANFTWTDHLVDNVSLSVKRLVNADSAGIPSGPNGEAFDGATHTHYDAINGLTAAALLASINDVVEHGFGGAVRVYINKADETAVRALTGFVAYPDPRIVYRNADTPGQTLDVSRMDNRAIGIFGAAEVWVKSWALAGYTFAFDAASPQKPLVLRTRTPGGFNLSIAAEQDAYPLHAQFLEDEYGFGVWNRTNGAVLYFGGASYVDPVIN